MCFNICNLLLKDFTHHHVDVFASLLETCGRYLYVLPFTHDRMNNIIDTMLRLRRSKNLDLRQQTMLESAYFTVKPPERAVGKVKKQEYTKIQKFILHLFYKCMGTTDLSVNAMIRLLRKLPWDNAEEKVEYFVIKASLKICRTKYVHIPLL